MSQPGLDGPLQASFLDFSIIDFTRKSLQNPVCCQSPGIHKVHLCIANWAGSQHELQSSPGPVGGICPGLCKEGAYYLGLRWCEWRGIFQSSLHCTAVIKPEYWFCDNCVPFLHVYRGRERNSWGSWHLKQEPLIITCAADGLRLWISSKCEKDSQSCARLTSGKTV